MGEGDCLRACLNRAVSKSGNIELWSERRRRNDARNELNKSKYEGAIFCYWNSDFNDQLVN